jgi:Family of unknown function (DUF5677)
MAFDADGFFSPTIEKFRSNIRKVPGYKPWFDFADVLNRLGLDMLRDHDVPLDDNRRLTTSVLFVRLHQSFQAAILLAERGLIGDARVVLRSAVEGAIAMYGVADDPTFIQQLIHANYHNDRKAARLLLNNADYKSSYSVEQIADMNAAIERADKAEAELGRKLVDIRWEQVAHKHCNDLYQLLYRPLSSAGTHTTLESIYRYVSHDADMQITAVNIGPDTADMVATLKFACLTFLWAADPFARVFDRNDILKKLQELHQQFARLPQEEPDDVAIIPSFRS